MVEKFNHSFLGWALGSQVWTSWNFSQVSWFHSLARIDPSVSSTTLSVNYLLFPPALFWFFYFECGVLNSWTIYYLNNEILTLRNRWHGYWWAQFTALFLFHFPSWPLLAPSGLTPLSLPLFYFLQRDRYLLF